tara:strand:+ start:1589 stop:1933 length:345 start_codon:yes stop_codon:yes gene_type:complete
MNNLINTPSPINRSFTTIDDRDDFIPIFRTPPRPTRRGVRRPRISDISMPQPLQSSPLIFQTPRPALPRRNRNPFSIRQPLFPTRKIAGKNKRKSKKRKRTLKNNSFKNKKRKL